MAEEILHLLEKMSKRKFTQPPLPPSFNIDGQSLVKELLKMFEMMRASASILNVGVQGGGFQFSGGF